MAMPEFRIGTKVQVRPDQVADEPVTGAGWELLHKSLRFIWVQVWINTDVIPYVPPEEVSSLNQILEGRTDEWETDTALVVLRRPKYCVAIWKRDASRYDVIGIHV